MKKYLILGIMLGLPLFAIASAIKGDWSGKLELGFGRALKIVLHISAETNEVTMDSPDQGAYGMSCETVMLSSDSISIGIPKLLMHYNAKLHDNRLIGTFKQGQLSLPLNLEHGLKKVNRPQTPKAPFPYKEEQVRISNSDSSVVLSGTLAIPENCSNDTPIAVLVTGSGSQNRDEELFEHKPFAVIADYLARNGIATLRYDDRGFAASTGDCSEATTEDYAQDAKMVINWIRDQNRFGKAGLIGHSEGGMIGYMLGAEENAPDFVISIAGPVVDGGKILDYQNKIALMRLGMNEAQAEEQARLARQRIEADPSQKWYQFFLRYDPAENLANLKSKALIIYGEKDVQVPPSLNYERAIQLAPDATVICYPGLNHLMQHAASGAVEEYGEIEETISPEVLQDIVLFIN